MKMGPRSDPESGLVTAAVTAEIDNIGVWTKGKCKSREREREKTNHRKEEIFMQKYLEIRGLCYIEINLYLNIKKI